MAISSLTNKGQVTIPQSIRKALGLNSGDKIEFTLNKKGEVVIRPATNKVDELFGMLYNKERQPVSTEEMDDAVKQKMRKEFE